MPTREEQRLAEELAGKSWKSWGPYLSERQWATVREDYSPDGNVWESVPHEMARSKAFRWGEDGIGGFSNDDQRICFSWAFWNGKDPILKERLFGLTSYEGNHGEDVKEYYYYQDNTPTHSFMKMLYKYPINRFPYEELVDVSKLKGKDEPEYELIDTGIFDNSEYWDITLQYAKNQIDDFLFEAEIQNKSAQDSEIFVLPQTWFRNTWSSGRDTNIPSMFLLNDQCIQIDHHLLGTFYLHFNNPLEVVFCDNETNRRKLYATKNQSKYTKDGINDYLIKGAKTINPENKGTKCAGIFKLKLPGGTSKKVKVRLSKEQLEHPWENFNAILMGKADEADEFYENLQRGISSEETKNIQRQAWAGMLWSKQFYYYNLSRWLKGDPGKTPPHPNHQTGRNSDWKHMYNHDVISMPDKWEYPWYAAWDLAFHTVPIARVDPEFAKNQLLLFLTENYQHPNGQIPAYEWNFTDVNPPVHAWAVLSVSNIEKEKTGSRDLEFLQKAFHKLLINFTWWVNRKDRHGNNIFEGGFLGLDNIGVFDRNHPIVENAQLEQADSTSWMAMFALNMLRISIELSKKYPSYEDMVIKFFEHFSYIGTAINGINQERADLWSDEDEFYFDVVHTPEQSNQQLKVKSMVGLIPLYAVEMISDEDLDHLPNFKKRLKFFLSERPIFQSIISSDNENSDRKLISIVDKTKLEKLLRKILDPEEFLSDFGIRALSKHHEKYPFEFKVDKETLSVKYLPGESDSSFFGGNSNWRGPIWFPVNFLLLESLSKFDKFFGDLKTEYPKNSGEIVPLRLVISDLNRRLVKLFENDGEGKKPIYQNSKGIQGNPDFENHLLFFEYFHGDNGSGLGASHQTGWTGLVAEIIHQLNVSNK